MRLRRGDLVWVAVKGPYTGKPRPAVVVQATATVEHRDSVTVCLLTSERIGAPAFRVRVRRSKWNGLTTDSDVMVDKIVTIPKTAIQPGSPGRLSPREIADINRALRFWLAL
jgi:mRNA interferase MazF